MVTEIKNSQDRAVQKCLRINTVKAVSGLGMQRMRKVETGFRDSGVINTDLEVVLKPWKRVRPGRACKREGERRGVRKTRTTTKS